MNKSYKTWLISTFHSNKIYIQLIIFTVVVSIIPILVMSSILFNRISALMNTTLNKSYSQQVAQYMSNINDNFYSYAGGLQQLTNNTIIIDELLGVGDSDNPYIKGRRISNEVNKSLLLRNNNEFRNCTVYSNMDDVKIYGVSASMMEQGMKEQWYSKSKGLEKGLFTHTTYDGKNQILSLIEKVYYIDTKSFNKKYLGIIKLDLNMDRLFQPVKENIKEDAYPYGVIVLDENKELIYSQQEDTKDIIYGAELEELYNEKMLIHNNKILYGGTISSYGLKVILVFENDVLIQKQKEQQRSMIIIVFIMIGIIALASYFFTRSFSYRIELLVNKIKLVEEGDLRTTEAIIGDDEVATLDKQFNNMIKRLNELIEKNYIQQLEKRETQLRNLQLQINPHFLYNTLETISSIAAINHVFDICDLCDKLGEVFRYSLGKNHGEYVTIQQELEHTKNYIFIQKMRFGDRFEVCYDIDNNILSNRVLRFILQPIVENAIVHGIGSQNKQGIIEISIEQENKDIIIKIEDDGAGMSSETMEYLDEYINDLEINLKRKTKSIGIKNVNQRIKLSCGKEYGITINSKLGQGSCFTIRLPYIK